jgi:hypothetical protein
MSDEHALRLQAMKFALEIGNIFSEPSPPEDALIKRAQRLYAWLESGCFKEASDE